jgi:hypothetical protein
MSQVLKKPYECLICKQQIRIAKIDNVPPGQKKKWKKYELDGVTLHVCHKQQPPEQSAATKEEEKQQPTVLIQKEPPTVAIADLADQVAELKSQIKTLVTQLQLMRQLCNSHIALKDKLMYKHQ